MLDVLMVLGELEECTLIPASDEAYNVGSDCSSPLRVLLPMELSDVHPTDASFSVLVMHVGGWRESILVLGRGRRQFQCGRGERVHAAGAMGGGGQVWD